MALGPGKYDDIATTARESTGAFGVVLIVLGGAHGSGFSVQADAPIGDKLPALLREVANQIERDVGGEAHGPG